MERRRFQAVDGCLVPAVLRRDRLNGLPVAVFKGYRGTDYPKVNPKIRFIECPFTGEELTVIPAHRPDVAIIATGGEPLVPAEGGSLSGPTGPDAGGEGDRIRLTGRAYEAATGADALVVVTEWNEFREPDLRKLKARMRHPALFDCRNIYNPQTVREMGFHYEGVGRR